MWCCSKKFPSAFEVSLELNSCRLFPILVGWHQKIKSKGSFPGSFPSPPPSRNYSPPSWYSYYDWVAGGYRLSDLSLGGGIMGTLVELRRLSCKILQMTLILQDARSRRLTCKKLARSCKIDVEKCLRKKWNFEVLLTQRSFSLMSSHHRRELSVQKRNFLITSAFNNIFEKLISRKNFQWPFKSCVLSTQSLNC